MERDLEETGKKAMKEQRDASARHEGDAALVDSLAALGFDPEYLASPGVFFLLLWIRSMYL